MAVNSGSDTGVRMSPIQISEHMKQVSSFRPSSVPLNLDITAVRGFDQCDGGSELGHMSEESLDRLKRDLSIMVEATMNATSENGKKVDNKKSIKKKISLPIKLSEERLTSTLPSESKSKSERKRSVDSSLNILSPTLSPDMKVYFKEKLKTNLRLDVRHKNKYKTDKSRQMTETKFQKGLSGYSHLECCANIPYNLEEEPEVVDGIKNPRVNKNNHNEQQDDLSSFTSTMLQAEDSNQTSSIVDHYQSGTLETCLETLQEIDDISLSNTVKSQKRELEGMDKVREMVLSNVKKSADDDSSESSLSEASGWVSNDSRRSSLSTDTNSENPRERSKSLIEQSKHHHLKSSCPRTNLPELKSPGLLLNKNSRSRSEEPPELLSSSPVFSCNRPRHRSECSSHRSFSPVRKFLPPHTPVSVPRRNVIPEITKTEYKNMAVPPPAQFQDPPKDIKLEAAVRESNFAKVRHKKGPENNKTGGANQELINGEKSDVKRESEIAIQKLYEAVSEITADKKMSNMSRSNTISFGDEGVNLDEGKFSDCESRRRKLNSVSENIVNQRMSSSMQAIDRKLFDTKAFVPSSKPPLYHDSLAFTCSDWIPNKSVLNDEKMLAKIAYMFGIDIVNYLGYREEFKSLTSFPGALYSDRNNLGHAFPYFTKLPESLAIESPKSNHLVVCVHGLDGNSADLRLVKTYLEMALPSSNLEFLMSEINQMDTFLSFEDMTKKLVSEIVYYVKSSDINIGKISFIGHSLGCILIRSAIQKPEIANFSSKFHTYLSLSGPHLGTMYNNSNLVNAGMWVMQRWKKSGSLQQLALKDSADIRQTFMYKLSQQSNLHFFKNVLLAGSSQDKYVPIHSARIELCKSAIKDGSVIGAAYKEMVNNILGKVIDSDVELVRYDVHHALPNNTNSLIGRAAHIAVLDSELFIEKFLVIAVLKYFQ